MKNTEAVQLEALNKTHNGTQVIDAIGRRHMLSSRQAFAALWDLRGRITRRAYAVALKKLEAELKADRESGVIVDCEGDGE